MFTNEVSIVNYNSETLLVQKIDESIIFWAWVDIDRNL